MAYLLLVEDDKSIVKNLSLLLLEEGFQIRAVSTQAEALAEIEKSADYAASETIDLILLDLSLPDGSGYAVCAAAKGKLSGKRRGEIPVIFLTAADDEANVVTGFEMGADDYVAKPFRPMELISRIKNVLRRSGKTQSVFHLGALEVDTVKGTVRKAGAEVFLSALEYRLLLLFLSSRGAVLTRAVLLEALWDAAGDFVNDNTLTVYIKRLRDKIEDDPQNPQVIKTVRGMGYRLEG